MRVIQIAVIMFLALLLAGICPQDGSASQTAAELLVEGIRAVDAERPILAKEKFKKVLEIESNNYHALVRLGQLEMEDLVSSGAGRRALEAERYFLLACVTQPHRPEAYLGLAEMYYTMGYFEKGDGYAKTAQDVEPKCYETFCVLGQRYEDSGNYTAAMDQYNKGLSVYGRDSYLIDKLYFAASQGGLEPYVVLRYGRHHLILRRFPDYFILDHLRKLAGDFPTAKKHYDLPNFEFKYCPGDIPPENLYKDPYEAFIMASTKDPAEYKKLRAKLDRIRDDAAKAIAGVKGDEAKARALYKWLKKNVLKNYDRKKGILADQVLNDNKYLCLSGSILYALIAEEVGLPVKGMITPGHAFASMDTGKRQIQIEVTAEPKFGMTREDGFDVDWWDQFKVLNRVDAYGGLYGPSSHRNIGAISPQELTAYQFINTWLDGVDKIKEEHKDQLEYAKTLQKLLIAENRAREDELAAVRGRHRRDLSKLLAEEKRVTQNYVRKRKKLSREMKDISREVNKKIVEHSFDVGLDLVKKAQALAPGMEEFVDIQEGIYSSKALVDASPALYAAEDRKEKRDDLRRELLDKRRELKVEARRSGGKSSFAKELEDAVESVKEKLKKVEEEANKDWDKEKGAWLVALKRLGEGLDSLPCSTTLKRRFESLCQHVAQLADRREDPETMNKVVSMAMFRVPDSRFVRRYREHRMGSL